MDLLEVGDMGRTLSHRSAPNLEMAGLEKDSPARTKPLVRFRYFTRLNPTKVRCCQMGSSSPALLPAPQTRRYFTLPTGCFLHLGLHHVLRVDHLCRRRALRKT